MNLGMRPPNRPPLRRATRSSRRADASDTAFRNLSWALRRPSLTPVQQESTARISRSFSVPNVGEIPGDVAGALTDVNVPCYVVDRFGVIRWINPAAEKLVGDVRGRQQSSVVAPEYA